MRVAGVLIFAIGGLLAYAAFMLDTTVSTGLLDEYASRTHNLGLLQDQQNLLFTGLCLVLSGFILFVGGSIVEQLESIKISNRSILLKEKDIEAPKRVE